MKTAEVTTTGQVQSILLPDDCHIEGKEVFVIACLSVQSAKSVVKTLFRRFLGLRAKPALGPPW